MSPERTAPLVRGRWATKTLDPCSQSKSMKELPVPYWSRVVSHRGIDVIGEKTAFQQFLAWAERAGSYRACFLTPRKEC